MPTVVGIRFKKAGKIYYFDPEKTGVQKGDFAIVETARGMEYGEVVAGVREVDEKEIIAPLKPVLRRLRGRSRLARACPCGPHPHVHRACHAHHSFFNSLPSASSVPRKAFLSPIFLARKRAGS